MSGEDDLVVAIGVNGLTEADMLRNMLGVEGIPAMVRRSPSPLHAPNWQDNGPHQLLVKRSDLDMARAILGAH